MYWPPLSPLLILSLLLCFSGVAGLSYRLVRRKRRKMLGSLARQLDMHYSSNDVFQMAARVAPRLPMVGAANVRVFDLIYGSDQQGLHYVFSAEYTAGVVRAKSRRRCVVSVKEPRVSDGQPDWSSIKIAAEELPLEDQYRSLIHPQAIHHPP